MDMDPRYSEFASSMNGFNFDDDNYISRHVQSPNLVNGIKPDGFDLDILDIPFIPLSPNPDNFTPSSTLSSGAESPDDPDSDPVLKFLNQILLEESMEEKPSMFHDPLALQAAEKSLYEVIGQEYPSSPYRPSNYANQTSDSPDSFGSSIENTNSSNDGSNLICHQWIVDPGENNSSVEQGHLRNSLPKSVLPVTSDTLNGFNYNSSNMMNSLDSTNLLQNIFSDSESILQFKRGMEEANKFLPTSKELFFDLDKYVLPKKSKDTTPVVVKVEKDVISPIPNGLRVRKYPHTEDGDSDDMERSSKQSAIYSEDVELSDMFDRVLLFTDVKGEPCCDLDANCSNVVDMTIVPNVGRTRARKTDSKGEAVDLRTLLIGCAQSVAADNHRTALEQLKHIRKHASPTGDIYQRLANIFTNGLEARLGGTGTELYAALARRKITAVEKLKAYQVYLSACPFKKMSIFFANKMIVSAASETKTLHIIDFGILYGFQWPILIQHLSQRPGGAPKLRITGIELPQPGFRPTERVEETGCRLKKYCERFGVPFEYQAIATQNWETIKIEDFKIVSGEVLAVNSLLRFNNLLDETVVIDSPRNAILNLIRQMKPDIFVNAVANGSYSAPFFITRFREALFHYSALFDMLDVTLPRDDPQRMDFEQDFYGREVINIIACEGAERVERPETYKQWQVRQMRAGFKPLPLNKEFMKKLRHKVTAGYHRDFLFDEDGSWMLQGWKGRIMYASSCWVPA